MTQGIYNFQICFQFNGSVEIKADSKKKALEVIKDLKASLREVKALNENIKDWNAELHSEAEERI